MLVIGCPLDPSQVLGQTLQEVGKRALSPGPALQPPSPPAQTPAQPQFSGALVQPSPNGAWLVKGLFSTCPGISMGDLGLVLESDLHKGWDRIGHQGGAV